MTEPRGGWEPPESGPPAGDRPPDADRPPEPPRVAWEPPPREVGPAPGVWYGGYGERLVAYIVDALIVGAIVTLVGLLVVGVILSGGDFSDPEAPELSGGAITGIVVLSLVALVLGVAYFPYFWARDGATPGMKLFGLRVVRDADGGPIDGGTAILRLVGMWVSGAVFWLGFIWIFVDRRRRGWHDLIAGTLVVQRPR